MGIFDFVKARLYRHKIRTTFIYLISEFVKINFHVSIINTLKHMIRNESCDFIWESFNCLHIKLRSTQDNSIADQIEDSEFYKELPVVSNILKGSEAKNMLYDLCSNHQNEYVYIIYDELDEVERIKGTDLINKYFIKTDNGDVNDKNGFKSVQDIFKKPDVYVVNASWTWIYMESHEEGERGFDVGPYFYSKYSERI